MNDLDFSGSAVLRAVVTELAGHGITFVLCDVQSPVLAELRRDGLIELLGEAHLFDAPQDVLAAYGQEPPPKVAHVSRGQTPEQNDSVTGR